MGCVDTEGALTSPDVEMIAEQLRVKLHGVIAFPVTPFHADMSLVGNLSQVISVPLVAWLAVLAGEPGHPGWKASLYFYAAMFFVASICWLFVDPRRMIVYADSPAK